MNATNQAENAPSPKDTAMGLFFFGVIIIYVIVAVIVAHETREVVVQKGIFVDTKELRSAFRFGKFLAYLVWPGILVYVGALIVGGLIFGSDTATSGGQTNTNQTNAGPSQSSNYRPPPQPPKATLEPFFQTYLHLAAKLCRADGPVSRAEIAFLDTAFVQEMGFDELQVKDARNCFRDGKLMDLNIEAASREVRRALGNETSLVDTHAVFLAELGRADGPLNPPEIEFLRTVFGAFGYTPAEIENLISPRQEANSDHGPTWERALELLDLQQGFSKEELRASYKEKVKEFHPDRLMSLSPGLRKLAEEQLKEINLAYAKLKGAAS